MFELKWSRPADVRRRRLIAYQWILFVVAAILGGQTAQALTLEASVGGNNAFAGVSCDQGPATVGVGVISNSVTCANSSSSAYASSGLVLGAYSASYGDPTGQWATVGSALYRENFRFSAPGLNGQAGTLLVNFGITGFTLLANSDDLGDAQATFAAFINDGTVDTTGLVTLRSSAIVPFLFHFTYGGPSFNLTVLLNAGTFGRNPDTIAIADFAHTAQVDSAEFRDANGNLVSDVVVTSQFGVNPFAVRVTPVPEPETYAMMLAGLGLLGFTSRRRKQSRA